MKIFIYILIGISIGLLIFNITKINWDSPFTGDSSVALIGVLACLCAIILLLILQTSKRIVQKHKENGTKKA